MSQDGIIIVVNGEKHSVEKPELSGAEILNLANFEQPPAGTIVIEYRGGPAADPAGTLKLEETVKIKEGMIFDVKEDITIIVNGRKKVVPQETISRNDLVNLAATDDPSIKQAGALIIDYRNGPRANPDGVLEDNETITIKDGMIFNVTATNRS